MTCKMRFITLARRRTMRYHLGVHCRCCVTASSDPFDHSIQYANSGHAPALHFEAATGEFVPLESTGMPLGVVDRPAYHQGWPLTLGVDDLLVFGTDGVVEAFDRHDRPFGRRRLEAIVGDALSLPVAQIVSRLGEAVQDHYGGGSPPDDLTIVTLRRNA